MLRATQCAQQIATQRVQRVATVRRARELVRHDPVDHLVHRHPVSALRLRRRLAGRAAEHRHELLLGRAAGRAAAAARTAAKEEAAGLEAINKANPARQERNVLQAGAEKKEVEKTEVKPASSVIEKLPVPKYASGGIAEMAKGRYLGGATDGMADKIPARIGGKQEAKLSHGEFVVPADVVSHLGNGNSDAGAKRLYEMMDRIRQARTGTTKQGKQVNPNKFLPT